MSIIALFLCIIFQERMKKEKKRRWIGNKSKTKQIEVNKTKYRNHTTRDGGIITKYNSPKNNSHIRISIMLIWTRIVPDFISKIAM